jgi:hypothetical protein
MLHGALLLAWLVPAAAGAQSATQVPPAPAGPSEPSKLWLVAGGAFATLRSTCDAPANPTVPVTCGESPYRHSGSLLANAGYRVSDRMDVGAELFWMPSNTSSGHIRVTHLDAIAQFRPWRSRGFFLKGGAGMAFLRNWVDVVGPESINQKALSVVIGTGWVFRPTERFGVEIFGEQSVAALGDVQTAEGLVQNVVGNFWSLGAAVVIR